MPHVHIGLDFGTSQTKVCLQHLDANPRYHEFVQFDGPDGPSFYLPSRLSVVDDRVRTGHAAGADAFRFFKIAAAEDEHFRTGSSAGADRGARYDASRFTPYTPELLSVLYLARTLLQVKAHVRQSSPAPVAPRTGFFRRSVPVEPAETTFTVQLGIPTEYLSQANRLRKRKFETILVLADQMAERAGTLDTFDRGSLREMVDVVAALNEALGEGESRGARLDDALGAQRLAVFPESAAGLAALTSSGRLDPGHYAAVDVGGGSTDVSFFRVNGDGTTSYLASESLLVASNDVYRLVAGDDAPEALSSAERSVRQLLSTGTTDQRVNDAIDAVTCQIYALTRRLFNRRVWERFNNAHKASGSRAMHEHQPCFFYGGGCALPVLPKRNWITVYDSGTQSTRHDSFTQMRRDALKDHLFTSHVQIRPGGDSVREQGHMLAVAFGLSFPQGPAQAVWDMRDYRYAPADGAGIALVPHPVNADRYVYDVVGRKWFGV